MFKSNIFRPKHSRLVDLPSSNKFIYISLCPRKAVLPKQSSFLSHLRVVYVNHTYIYTKGSQVERRDALVRRFEIATVACGHHCYWVYAVCDVTLRS